jgi:hypothetical protein
LNDGPTDTDGIKVRPPSVKMIRLFNRYDGIATAGRSPEGIIVGFTHVLVFTAREFQYCLGYWSDAEPCTTLIEVLEVAFFSSFSQFQEAARMMHLLFRAGRRVCGHLPSKAYPRGVRKEKLPMSTTTLFLLIVLGVVTFGGSAGFYWTRERKKP